MTEVFPIQAHKDKLTEFKLLGFNFPATQMASRDGWNNASPLKIPFFVCFFEDGII